MKETDIRRNIELAANRVDALKLNLEGLTVLTECASGAYAMTPVLAAMAGARVLAVGRDSAYGTFRQNSGFVQELLALAGLDNNVEFFQNELPDELWRQADIVTNGGQLRPFTAEKIEKLDSRAVICLMWETWEVRADEIDFAACQRRGIPVIGTNENFPAADMYGYPAALCLKMLFEMGLEVANNHFVLLGEGLTGRLIAESFRKLGIHFDLYVASLDANDLSGDCRSYDDLATMFELPRLDCVICADHATSQPVVGDGCAVTFDQIHERFPCAKWAHLTGAINIDELKRSGMDFYPRAIKPFGYMSYESIQLGWEPVIVLNAAGLKVGQVAAQARQAAGSAEDSIRAAVDHGVGQDFEGGFFNVKFS